MVAACLLWLIWFMPRTVAPIADETRDQPSISLLGPNDSDAGRPIELTLRSPNDPDYNGTVSAFVTDALGTTRHHVVLSNGQGTLLLASNRTEHAGLLSIHVDQGSEPARHDVRIRPGPMSSPLIAVVGQRSLLVGGDSAMLVISPLDAFGNAVAPGLPLSVEVRRPGVGPESYEAATQNLVVGIWLGSSDRAGVGTVSVTSVALDGLLVTSQQLEFRQVAGSPATVAVVADVSATPLLADGRTLIRLRTNHLEDRFGNVVANGTIVNFLVEAPDGWSHLTSTVIDGYAECRTAAPSLPGTVRVTVSVAGVTGTTHEFRADPAVDEVPFRLLPVFGPARAFLELQIGPVMLSTGGLVPDGTAASLSVAGAPLVVEDVSLRNGEATVAISLEGLTATGLSLLDLTVAVLGHEAGIR